MKDMKPYLKNSVGAIENDPSLIHLFAPRTSFTKLSGINSIKIIVIKDIKNSKNPNILKLLVDKKLPKIVNKAIPITIDINCFFKNINSLALKCIVVNIDREYTNTIEIARRDIVKRYRLLSILN